MNVHISRLIVIYYSKSGNTEKMAEAIGKGARQLGVEVEVKSVEDCALNDLVEASGIVIGSPTYFSNVAWQIKKLIDESIAFYPREQLRGKVGGCFTSAGTRRDGEECLRMLALTFGFHHKLKIVPGILSASGDKEQEVYEKCDRYGLEIARQILSQ
jgi:NAD(P)H dehydrogenase (quinone)